MVHPLRVGQDNRAEYIVLVQDNGSGWERSDNRVRAIVFLRGAKSEVKLYVEQSRFQLLEHRLPDG